MPLRALLILLALFLAVPSVADPRSPNIVLIYADDLGYADIGPFGAKAYKTPHLDRLAAQGRRFTSFHVSQPVCSASRTSLLTGCYANRLGIHGALGPQARHGIADTEMTLAELLKQKGYATGMAGKWHLGHHPKFLPTRHGFDEYFGLPYSNDMWPHHPDNPRPNFPKLPLIESDKTIDEDVTASDQELLTAQYTDRAVRFIERNRVRPFFFYLAHSMPHVPIFAGEKFRGKSGAGTFGDVIQEIDWSVGEVMGALKRSGLERDTLVIFTSDNGPWLSYGEHAGSAGPFKEGKGTVWEGGTRVPCIMRWPGKIPARSTSSHHLMTIDLFPTIAGLAGAELPKHKIDGRDVWPIISGRRGAANPHDAYFSYYHTGELHAVTAGDGRWKLMLPHTYRSLAGRPGGKGGIPARYEQFRIEKPELYNLIDDPGETNDVAAGNLDVVARLLRLAEQAREDLGDALTRRTGTGVREPGRM